MKKTKILFVCLGNICRSPTAQGVFEKIIIDKNLADKFFIDSAGTAAYHIGKKPDSRSIFHAAKRGYDLTHQRARKVDFSDFYEFDKILAMDKNNYDDLMEIAPQEAKNKISMILDFADKEFLNKINSGSNEVPDPYYGGDAGFEKVLDLVENACIAFLKTVIYKI